MVASGKFCLVGQILVDVTLSSGQGENKLRLGGLMHAARALWALDVDYCLAYAAPSYLVPLIEDFARKHGVTEIVRIADIEGSPNVVLIPEPTEAGSQGYELLLRESQQPRMFSDQLQRLASRTDLTDIVVFPGGFDLSVALKALAGSSTRCHIDIAYDVASLDECRALGRPFDVVMISTSSDLFLKAYGGDPDKIRGAILGSLAKRVLLKENRGGARLYRDDGDMLVAGAQLRPVEHSVGVGDCFDVAFATIRNRHSEDAAMAYASFIAAEYAATTYPDDFKLAVTRNVQIPGETIKEIEGVRVPWEQRKRIHVYIAAPDFDYVNRAPIDALHHALTYHNFSSRRPVQEHGQVQKGDTRIRRSELFSKDMRLLKECQILVAVLMDNDPGTLIEIGLAKEQGKPVVVYDPYRIAENLVLQHVPDTLTTSLDEAVAAVFQYSAKLLPHLP